MIRIENLEFSYDRDNVLQDINLTIHGGEIVTLLGPNGSGKSTLLKCVYGILSPVRGKILVDKRNLSDFSHSELARIMGGIPQHHYPAFPFKVIDIVVMGRTPYLNIFTSPTARDYALADLVLKNISINHLKHQKYTEISGGERQLVLIARALMQEPKILLLDEPVTHLDIKNKIKVLGTIKTIAKKQDLTVLATLHDPNDAMMFSDRIALIKKGSLLENGRPADVISADNLKKTYDMDFTIIRQKDYRIVSYRI